MSRRQVRLSSRTHPQDGSHRPCRKISRPRTWAELLADYETEHAPHEREEVRWFAGQRSLVAAIRAAALAVDHLGKRYDHQFRIRRAAVATAAKLLSLNVTEFRSTRSFPDLLAVAERLLLPARGIGELYCYDCAARIGAYLRIEPDRVYLHAGTRVGARALKLPYRRAWLEMSELPRALRGKRPREVENILCIYAEDFSRLVHS